MVSDLELYMVAILAAGVGIIFGRHSGRRGFWRAGHYAGQVEMKERIRQQINKSIREKNISIRFRDGTEISAEQLLQFLCYGSTPDPNDASHGVSNYNPK